PKTAGDDTEPVGGDVDVRIVDLKRIAGEDDFGPFARARDDGFHFVRRQVLGFVDDHVLLGQAATPDVRQRLDFDLAALEQILKIRNATALARAEQQELQIVEDRLHPRTELLLNVAGQITEIAPQRDYGTADEQARIPAIFDRTFETR